MVCFPPFTLHSLFNFMCCSHAEIFLAALGFLGCLAYLSQEWEGRYRNTGYIAYRPQDTQDIKHRIPRIQKTGYTRFRP